MKIDRKELEEAEREQKKPLDQRIIDILKQNNDYAFELIDLIEMLETELPKGRSGFDTIWALALGLDYTEALSKLETEGEIQKVSLKNSTYYTLAKVGTDPPIIIGIG